MHALLVTPEIAPLVVATERAHAASGLARALCAEGADVTIVAPLLHGALRQQHVLARRLEPLRFTLDGFALDKDPVEVTLFEGKLAGCGARVLLLDHERFAAISPVANSGAAQALATADSNDATPFAMFARAALQVTVDLALRVDLVHAHDWQCALLPLLAHRLTTRAEIRDLPIVLSVHRPELPGHFHPDAITQAAWFDETNETPWTMDGPSSLLYTGMLFADAVTADSSEAADLLAERIGHSGLPEWMASRLALQPPITPALPGLDYEQWSSDSSRHIAAHYGSDSSAGKSVCKTALLQEVGLAAVPSTPLLAVLPDLGGADLLLDRADALAEAGVQLAFIGQPSAELDSRIAQISQQHPRLIGAVSSVLDEATVQRLLAGADGLFLPASTSDSVPMLLKALAFGTIPIACATAGTKELVVDFDPPSATGTALLMSDATPDAALSAIRRLCAVYECEPRWRQLRHNAFGQRFGWRRPAQQHLEVYHALLAEAPGELSSPA